MVPRGILESAGRTMLDTVLKRSMSAAARSRPTSLSSSSTRKQKQQENTKRTRTNAATPAAAEQQQQHKQQQQRGQQQQEQQKQQQQQQQHNKNNNSNNNNNSKGRESQLEANLHRDSKTKQQVNSSCPLQSVCQRQRQRGIIMSNTCGDSNIPCQAQKGKIA
ncbi:unnamed protein product [Polarella glacialis]|uniref:Uncharacterized protein n=1 Tax=Polarella glacialis TaxID=89957 RepID=A0A813GGD2_POLGL|nr:unnamed protein product [Polarella glacialis]